MNLLIHDLGTISLIAADDIEPDAIYIYSQMLIKLKSDERLTARLAAGGNRQPLNSYGETFAPTASESSTMAMIAAYQAHGQQQNLKVGIVSFDLASAFQNTQLDKVNFPKQIVMILQKDLPHPWAGKTVLVHKAINGLKQANELFDREFREQMHLAGFIETCDHCVYTKTDEPIVCNKYAC
jgi:hypothetical protein